MNSKRVKTSSKMSGKTKEAKEKSDYFVLAEKLWTNCHAIKIQIKRTIMFKLSTKVKETTKGADSTAFIVNLEQVMPLLK